MAPRTYQVPGPGTWEQDPTHFARPVTQYFIEVFAEPFMQGFKEWSTLRGSAPGMDASPGRDMPKASMAVDMVLAVKRPAQEPSPGQA